jgi:hypothetical protein
VTPAATGAGVLMYGFSILYAQYRMTAIITSQVTSPGVMRPSFGCERGGLTEANAGTAPACRGGRKASMPLLDSLGTVTDNRGKHLAAFRGGSIVAIAERLMLVPVEHK